MKLSDADAALGRLAGSGRLLPNPHLLVNAYVTKEAVSSSRIEGTQASVTEVFDAVVTLPKDDMWDALDDWEKYCHDEHPRLALLVRCALLHYQFETIHPFLDGNGRLGRLFIALYLMERGRLSVVGTLAVPVRLLR